MKIVTVIPIARGLFKDELTYFTTLAVERGAIVSVPVRNRTVEALVIGVQTVEEIKAALRTADFPLQKIIRIKHSSFFSTQFLTAAARTADYFVGTLGQTLKSLVPAEILSAGSAFKINNRRPALVPPAAGLAAEKYVLQEPDDERLTYYKGFIREEFAKNVSVFLCLPTLTDIKKVLDSLERGIADYTVVFHHALGRTTLLEHWRRALATAHPILVIATPMFLSLPRADIATLIIDRENTSTYKALARPFLDYRVFAEFLAAAAGQRLILGDVVLRVETTYRLERGIFQVKTPIKHHAFSNAEQKIISLNAPGKFRVLSDELIETIAAAVQSSERFFIFAHRRGFEPLVICQDCGAAVICRNCEAPVSLYEGGENFLLCRHCGGRRSADEKCRVCGGWRLLGLGIGIDLVAKELTAALPGVKIFKLDGDATKSETRTAATVKKFLETPGGLLLGTEKTTFHLREKIENAAVAAIDSMFALPDYRINERIFSLLIRLRALATKRFLIQVRNVKSHLFDYANRGSLLDFYRQEIAERREYGYPPYRLFIKVTLTGNREKALLGVQELGRRLTDYEFDTFPSPFPKAVGRPARLNLLLRLDAGEWPNPALAAILKSLPPQFIVTVDPENLLN